MSKSTLTPNLAYYLLWTEENQQRVFVNSSHRSEVYDGYGSLLAFVSKAGHPKAVLFEVSPFDLQILSAEGLEKSIRMELPKLERVFLNITLQATYDAGGCNLITVKHRAEVYQLFIIPTKMQKVFEAHILEEHPDCILT